MARLTAYPACARYTTAHRLAPIRIAPDAYALRLHRLSTAKLAHRNLLSDYASNALPASTEPCIAGLAVDEYSISTGSYIFRNPPVKTTSGLRHLLHPLVRPAIPPNLRLRLHPLSGLAATLRLSPAVRSTNHAGDPLPACAGSVSLQLPATCFNALLGYQLKRQYVRSICGYKCKKRFCLWISLMPVQSRIFVELHRYLLRDFVGAL